MDVGSGTHVRGDMGMRLPQPIDKLRIVLYPAAVLRKRCAPIRVFDDALVGLAQRMVALMHEARGVGLAAPQVGVPQRLFVCNPTGEPGDDAVWVNPELSDLEGAVESDEGCLSIPGVHVPKRRAARVRLRGCDVYGRPVEATGADLQARIWQHETDHLNGVLVIDGMSETAELTNRRTLRQLEIDYTKGRRPTS